jgi:hypothetical protein
MRLAILCGFASLAISSFALWAHASYFKHMPFKLKRVFPCYLLLEALNL